MAPHSDQRELNRIFNQYRVLAFPRLLLEFVRLSDELSFEQSLILDEDADRATVEAHRAAYSGVTDRVRIAASLLANLHYRHPFPPLKPLVNPFPLNVRILLSLTHPPAAPSTAGLGQPTSHPLWQTIPLDRQPDIGGLMELKRDDDGTYFVEQHEVSRRGPWHRVDNIDQKIREVLVEGTPGVRRKVTSFQSSKVESVHARIRLVCDSLPATRDFDSVRPYSHLVSDILVENPGSSFATTLENGFLDAGFWTLG